MFLPTRVRSTRPKAATLNALPQRKEPSQRKNRRSENTPRSEKDRRHEIIRRIKKNSRNEIIRRHEKTRPDAAFIIRGTRTGTKV